MPLTDITVAADLQSIADQASMVIQPNGTEEWVIHNIEYGGAMELYRVSAAGSLLFDSDTGSGARLGYAFHVTLTQWLEMKNVSGGPVLIGYDGIVTHL